MWVLGLGFRIEVFSWGLLGVVRMTGFLTICCDDLGEMAGMAVLRGGCRCVAGYGFGVFWGWVFVGFWVGWRGVVDLGGCGRDGVRVLYWWGRPINLGRNHWKRVKFVIEVHAMQAVAPLTWGGIIGNSMTMAIAVKLAKVAPLTWGGIIGNLSCISLCRMASSVLVSPH